MSGPRRPAPGSDSGRPPVRQAVTPDLATRISLGLLLVFALLLLTTLLGLGHVPVWVMALLLLARLGVQFWSARQRPGQVRRRASGWIIDLALIGVLLYVGLGQK
ncbi:hypothetical protein Q0M94_13820 [Deinococcus radiomollis]|uniref:hypothetical protein n=1 Tax=Deinococcus radiomollis TaxID=468916 RepID=UPI0038921692